MNASNVVALVVALEHVWFLVLEMFLWTKPLGLKTFRRTQEQANESATLAMNQGLYNGFLAAGLVWGVFGPELVTSSIKAFFFGCVVVAGIFGGITVNFRIALVQAVPALLGLVLVLLGH